VLLPYGEELSQTANGKVKFATYWRDEESGLDYADQRYYSVGFGRFATADPYLGSARVTDPTSWNRYSYSYDDPVNWNDPTGLVPCNVENPTGCPVPVPGAGDGPISHEEVTLGPDVVTGTPIALSGTSNTPIRVSNFSRSGSKQDKITDIFKKIHAGLSQDGGDCERWLRGGGVEGIDLIDALVSNSTYGHGTFNVETTAAFAGSRNADGSDAGVPADAAITVNSTGAFFTTTSTAGANWVVGARGYAGGTLRAQATILIHELAHVLGAAGFKSDFGDPGAGRANDRLIDQNCRNLIERLR
jgi:RHS repeat-associated protein